MWCNKKPKVESIKELCLRNGEIPETSKRNRLCSEQTLNLCFFWIDEPKHQNMKTIYFARVTDFVLKVVFKFHQLLRDARAISFLCMLNVALCCTWCYSASVSRYTKIYLMATANKKFIFTLLGIPQISAMGTNVITH